MNEHHHEPAPEHTPEPPVPDGTKRTIFDLALDSLRLAAPEADPTAPEPTTEAAAAEVRRWASELESFANTCDAYLSLDLPVADGIRQIDDLLERSVGFAPNRVSFVALQLERLGLVTALADLRDEYGMRGDDVFWSEDAVWEQLCERLHIVEGFGGVHGFWR